MTRVSIISGDFWSNLEFELSELRDLFYMRLETEDEARGEKISPAKGSKTEWRDTAPRWEDPEHWQLVRPWLMIPHVDAVDLDELQEQLEGGKRLISSVEKPIAARELTPELLHDWGLLNRIAGGVRLIYQMKPDARLLRSGANSLEVHKRWFAHYFLKIGPRGNKDERMDVMEKFINSIVKDLPEGSERDWFERFLSEKASDILEDSRRLTNTFREKLEITQMRELDKFSLKEIPPFALRFPTPRGGIA